VPILAGASSEVSPDAAAVACEVDRIAASPSFRKAGQCVRLLRYLTSRALEGRGSELKEYALGVSVFERPDSFDPQTDAVVRLEARRLRLKLAEYYQQEGLDDPVIIELPKGAYVPRFRARLAPPQVEAPVAIPAPAALPAFRRWTIAVTAAAVLLATGSAMWLRMVRTSVQPPARQSVAVLRIRDLSKTATEGWLQTALPEMLTSELAAGSKLRTIPTEDVARWRTDLGEALDSESQAAVFRSASSDLGADTFVLGSYVVTGTCPQCRIRVDLGVFRARTGERLGAVIDEGTAADLLDFTTRLGHGLRAELGLRNDVAAPSRWPAASAMREYSDGLANLRQGDPLAAREHLEAAVAADPQNALIHSALAETWTALGYGTRADEEDKRAYDLAGSLDRLDQLGVEGRYRASTKDWTRAIEIYRTIFKLFPDSLSDGLNLARVQWRAGHIADSTATLNELRRLPKPAGNDPRIDMNEAQAAGTQNDFARTRELAHRAAEEAKARGARYLFARARLLEGGAMQNIGDPNASAVQDEARQVCEAIRDRNCVSNAWRIRGNQRYYSGDFQGAQQAYSQGVVIARDLGNQAELANLLVGFGVVEEANRDWRQAEGSLQEAISLKQQVGFNPNEVRNELAELYISAGLLNDAERLLQFERTTAEQTGAHEDLGDMLLLQAMIERLHGQLNGAEQLSERGMAELRRTGDPIALAAALAEVSSVHTAQGKLDQAEKDLAEAGNGTGPENLGALALSRAELSMAKGQFQDAAQEAHKAAEYLDKAHVDYISTQAFVTEADALDMSQRHAEAIAACREAGKRAQLTTNQRASGLAGVCSWRLSAGYEATIPPQLQAQIAKQKDPELKLDLDYAYALRSKRAGAASYRVFARQLAGDASKLGYVTVSLRAASLIE
jgi:TolB-like protein